MVDPKNMFAVNKALDLCNEGDHQLLYLSIHGSKLYGSDHPDSDYDYKGVFLPNLSDIMLGKKFQTLDFKSKENPDGKNSKDDIDLQLFSAQFWLNKLVKKGETEGIELLFSFTHPEGVLYFDPRMSWVFSSYTRLFDPRNTEGFLGFAISQARTYFTKAERFNVIKDVFEYLNRVGAWLPHDENDPKYLWMVIDDIVEQYHHPTYCFLTESNDLRAIQICGKVHQETILLHEFYERIQREYKKYGHRTRTAADLDNKDWKSLSSALKAIYEVRSLLTDGGITFPLKERDLIRDVKLGGIPFDEVEKLIFSGIEEVDALKESFSDSNWNHYPLVVKHLIERLYTGQIGNLHLKLKYNPE